MTTSWLVSLFLNPERSDLKVQCFLENGDVVRFPVHSPIICAQSAFFREELSSNPHVQEITILDFSPRVVEYYFRFFYTNCIPEQILFEDLLSLVELAHRYRTGSLVELCCSKLSLEVSVDTVCEVYEISKLRNFSSLVELCGGNIVRLWETVTKDDLHLSLSLESIQRFKMANVDVVSNLSAFKRWLNWNSYAHGAIIEDIDQICHDWSIQDEVFKSPYITSDQDNPWPAELCCSSYLSDVDIVVEGNGYACFPAHSLVLNKHSEVFLKMWAESTRASGEKYRLCLKKCNVRVVEYFLRFLYTRFFPVEMSLKNLLGLVKIANEYQVKELKSKCEPALHRKISIQNCCHILATTRNLFCVSVREECIRIAALHLDSILSNYLHFSLDQVLLTSVLRASRTRFASSNEYLQAWGKWYCVLLGCDLNDVDTSRQVEAVVAAAYMPLP